jgi:hypothetical protein
MRWKVVGGVEKRMGELAGGGEMTLGRRKLYR